MNYVSEMNKKYAWKNISYPVDADTAGFEIERIQKQNNGDIKPEQLVEASRSEDAALHPCFDWNDSTAAEKYRTHQARNLIGSLTVIVTSPKNEDVPTRAFVSVKEPETPRKYVDVQSAFEKPSYRNSLLEDALADYKQFKQKYKILSELAKAFVAFDLEIEELIKIEPVEVHNDRKGVQKRRNDVNGVPGRV